MQLCIPHCGRSSLDSQRRGSLHKQYDILLPTRAVACTFPHTPLAVALPMPHNHC